MIRLQCPCGAKLKADDGQVGQEFDCPKCGKRVRVQFAHTEMGESANAVAGRDFLRNSPAQVGEFANDAQKTKRRNVVSFAQSSIGQLFVLTALAIMLCVFLFVETRLTSASNANELAVLRKRLSEMEKKLTDNAGTAPTRPTDVRTEEFIAVAQPAIPANTPPMRDDQAQAEAALNAKREQIQEAREQLEREKKLVDDIYIRIGMSDLEERNQLRRIDAEAMQFEAGDKPGLNLKDHSISRGASFPGPMSDAIREKAKRELEALLSKAPPANGAKFSNYHHMLLSMADIPMPDAMRPYYRDIGERTGIRVWTRKLEESQKRLEQLERDLNN